MIKSHRRRGRRRTSYKSSSEQKKSNKKEQRNINENKIDKKEAIKTLQILSKELKTETFGSKVFLRDDENLQIKNFIYQNFFCYDTSNKKQYSTMVIFGQPGLGKTMLINQILEEMEEDQHKFLQDLLALDKHRSRSVYKYNKKIFKKEIIQIKINAMRTTNCFGFLLQLYKELSKATKNKKKISQKNYAFILQELKKLIIKTTKDSYIVVFIDELEELFYKDLKKFDSIIEFLNINKKGFVKICISNQLNLAKEEGFQKVFVFFQFLIFKPYKEKQIQQILKQKLKKCLKECHFQVDKLFSDKVMQYLAKKNLKSNFSDFRNLLKLVEETSDKKLKEIKKLKQKKKIQQSIIQFKLSDFEDLFKFQGEYKKYSQIFENLSKQFQYFLFSIYLLNKNKKRVFFSIQDVDKKFKELITNIDLSNNINQKQIIEYLENYGFIKQFSFSKSQKKNKLFVQLQIEINTFEQVLKYSKKFNEYFNDNQYQFKKII